MYIPQNIDIGIDDYTLKNDDLQYLICELLNIDYRTCSAVIIEMDMEKYTVEVSAKYFVPKYAYKKNDGDIPT